MGRKFEKGNKAAVGKGRPPAPPDLKGVTYLTQDHVKRQVALFLETPMTELERIAKDKEESGLRSLVAQIIVNAYTTGDPNRLNFLLDRCVGKVKEERDVNVKIQALPSVEEARQILAEDYAMLPAPDVTVEDL